MTAQEARDQNSAGDDAERERRSDHADVGERDVREELGHGVIQHGRGGGVNKTPSGSGARFDWALASYAGPATAFTI